VKALITGASSGIGREMAKALSAQGYDLVITARRENRLGELKGQLKTNTEVIAADLSEESECLRLYNNVKGQNIDILINAAGFGVFGAFDETDLTRELDLINVDIKALHILTKLFYKDFKKRGSGYILNVASAAAFQPGPLFSSYYAAKAYVLHLTEALAEELRRSKSPVYIGALCPGPVATEFDSVADVRFSLKNMSAEYVAGYAIKQMFKRKTIIIPGTVMKLAPFAERFISRKFAAKAAYSFQRRKA